MALLLGRLLADPQAAQTAPVAPSIGQGLDHVMDRSTRLSETEPECACIICYETRRHLLRDEAGADPVCAATTGARAR
jgi:hypothetical protein